MSLLRRWLAGLVCGIVVYFLLKESAGRPVALLVAWDAAIIISITLPWLSILRSTPENCRERARMDDPGDGLLLVVSMLVSLTALIGTLSFLTQPDRYSDGIWAELEPWLVSISIVGGWILLQTGFTLHYARQYYGDHGHEGGLDFKGGQPDDLDFAYFAFGIGVAFQVSDITISSRSIRRTVLLHSVLSFGYNAAILALSVNLIAGRMV